MRKQEAGVLAIGTLAFAGLISFFLKIFYIIGQSLKGTNIYCSPREFRSLLSLEFVSRSLSIELIGLLLMLIIIAIARPYDDF